MAELLIHPFVSPSAQFWQRMRHGREAQVMYRKQAMSNESAESKIEEMKAILDKYSAVPEEDRGAAGNEQPRDMHAKAVELAVKARKILCDVGRSKVTLEGDSESTPGHVNTTVEMVQMGRRRAGKIYNEVDKEPKMMLSWVISFMLVGFLLIFRAWLCLAVYIYNLTCIDKLVSSSKEWVCKTAESCGLKWILEALAKVKEWLYSCFRHLFD
ncbi:uncharacterized protein LOC135226373 [Macrobrachium nipponense]|uniref:uncharacterized protein LOC135226373 n=1 Tax=Macrobrachium nipponense TaxID=159736 RepID=UPI0030C819B4